ncbi:MAG TPA: TIGR03668 family PPOX class F420-dependent oxidoreductase [Chloroflexia bacterium]|nr:TIGR03668 family PPOX class F420-dependent oxidoreductase [Chloroflexia bacterium]
MADTKGVDRLLFTPEQAAYLAEQRVARLATVDSSGKPSVVPVCYAFAGGFIYIALDDKPKSVPPTNLKRVRNLLRMPGVALVVDSYSDDWSTLRYVMVSGEAGLVPPATTVHAEAVNLLRQKYPQYGSMKIDERPLIAIRPTNVHAWQASLPGRWAEAVPPVDFATLVRERHVVRQFKPDPVPRELVEQTLEAARWAPSPHGAQPWRFVVITRPEPKERLAGAMAGEWRRNLAMDGDEPGVVEKRLRISHQRIVNSPVIIIPCLYLEDLHAYPDPVRAEAEVTMAVQSLGAAVQNILLSARSLGLDTGWMCAPLFAPDVVRDALDLPGTLTPHALINMGYGAKDPPRREHRPVDQLIVSYE